VELKNTGPNGPAIWIDPEPPDDYTYHPVNTEALVEFLKNKKTVLQDEKETRRAISDLSYVTDDLFYGRVTLSQAAKGLGSIRERLMKSIWGIKNVQ
jgi:hypothetical protein